MNQPVEGVDARTDRVAQGVIGVALLGAFVFRIPWLVPALALLLAIAAIGGSRANAFHQVFERWLAPRLPSRDSATAEEAVPESTVRAQDALATVILLLASLAFLLGIDFVGWLFALAEAVIAIIAATTRVHVAERIRRRL